MSSEQAAAAAAAASTSDAVTDMLARGLVRPLDASTADEFLAGDGLQVLFFTGGKSHMRDAHDVAVALRELLRDYRGMVAAAMVSGDGDALLARFRVSVLPSLVLVLGGETLEILPRVRDWADYAGAFRRYLGAPRSTSSAEVLS